MIRMYKWHKIKTMEGRGESIKGIMRELKLSRNTVRKYVRSSDPPKFTAREYERELDGYEEEIKEMLGKKYIGTRIFDELGGIGYEGSLSSVHRYIREIKGEEERSKKVTTRMETSPGEQMQYDWKEWLLPVGGKEVKIYLHEVVLSYSRKKYYTYSLGITTNDVIRAIEEGIHYIGGTAREVMIDNPKQMVITHEKDGVIRYNDEFLKFCGLYGIEPNPCWTYRARTKGKAERPFYYIQEHLLRGLEVKDLGEFDEKLRGITQRYNEREHSKLKESPDERFKREKEYLRKVPKVEPTSLYERPFRKVSNDGYVSFRGGLYPVPMRLCLKEVKVESVFGRLLRVYDDKGILAVEHQVNLFETGLRPEHPEHEEENRKYQERRRARKSQVVKRFVETFRENGEFYLEGLKKKVGFNLYWHLKEIMRFVDLYEISQIDDVLRECILIGAYHKNSVKRLLKRLKIQKPIGEDFVTGRFTSSNTYPKVDITRGLSQYTQEVFYE